MSAAKSPSVSAGLKSGFTTYATGIVYGLQPDALFVVIPALALPTKLAAIAYCSMFVIGTVSAMGGYTLLIGERACTSKTRRALEVNCSVLTCRHPNAQRLSDLVSEHRSPALPVVDCPRADCGNDCPLFLLRLNSTSQCYFPFRLEVDHISGIDSTPHLGPWPLPATIRVAYDSSILKPVLAVSPAFRPLPSTTLHDSLAKPSVPSLSITSQAPLPRRSLRSSPGCKSTSRQWPPALPLWSAC